MADLTPGTTINIGQPATHETQVTDPTSTDVTKTLSPEQAAIAAESRNTTEAQIAGTAPRATYDAGVAQIQARTASDTLDATKKIDDARDKIDTAGLADIARKADVLRAANDAIKAQPAPALFADRDGWGKAKLALGFVLTGASDAIMTKAAVRLGRPLNDHSAVTDLVNMDLDRQRANIAKLTASQLIAKEGVKDAQEARQLALAQVDARGARILNQLALHGEALLKAQGQQLPQIQQNETILALRRAEVERQQAAVAGLTREHSAASKKTETTDRTLPDTGNKGEGRMGVVRNPDGSPAGEAPAGEAAAVNEQTSLRVQADRSIGELMDHVNKYGAGINPVTQQKEFQDRAALFARAKIAVGSVSALGKSDEALKTEMEALGPSGNGVWDANPSILTRVRRDIRRSAADAIKIHTTIPGATRGDATTGAAPVRPPVAGAAPALAPGPSPELPPSVARARAVVTNPANQARYTPEQWDLLKRVAGVP